MPLAHDVRYAARALGRSRGFTTVAVLTLSLGIGAATAIFSVVNAVLLRDLPYPDADRIVQVFQIIERPTLGTPLRGGLTPDQFQIWLARARGLSHIGVHGTRTYTLTELDQAVRLHGAAMTPSLFPLLDIAPVLGRVFEPSEAQPGAEPVVILSQDTWERHLGSDPEVVGRILTLEGNPYRVVGVMPRRFAFPSLDYRNDAGELDDIPQFWVPVGLQPPNPNPTTDVAMMPTLARLAPGLTVEQAQAEANVLVPPVRPDQPVRVEIVPLREELVGAVRPALLMLQTGVGFLLLIACANVTNLLLARGAARQRELAIRLALGAGRGQLTRDILAESLLLAAGGGAGGCLLAWWGTRFLRTVPPGTVPRVAEASIDMRVVLFALGVSLATGLIVGLATAVRVSRTDPLRSLRRTAAGDGGGAGTRPSSALAIAQVAAATVLLVGAGLLANSFLRLTQIDPGFNPNGVISFQIALPRYRYADTAQHQSLYTQLHSALTALPDADAVMLGNSIPPLRAMLVGGLEIDGEQATPPIVAARMVTPGFFQGLGIPLQQGRALTDRDIVGQPPVAVVSESFATQHFPTREALGAEFDILRSPEPITIVGIVGDTASAEETGVVSPEVYFSYLQFPSPNPRFSPLTTLAGAVRTTRSPGVMAAAIRATVRQLDPDLAVDSLVTMHELQADSRARARFYLTAATGLGLVALLMAALGIYGVLAYAVSQRTRELGIRIALGADRSGLVRMVSKQGLVLALAGLAIGLVGALWVTRFLESLLFGVTTRDPTTLLAVVVAFLGAALAACYIPARRATRGKSTTGDDADGWTP
ncbi:MAG: ABC transporter permease [Acidobacteria bacterium]|nr:ABC transporter permease [Acidobacteriota bacterium]